MNTALLDDPMARFKAKELAPGMTQRGGNYWMSFDFEGKSYTWRVKQTLHLGEGVAEMSLCKGPMWVFDGEVFGNWRISGSDFLHGHLYYRFPESFTDDLSKQRWRSVVLLMTRAALCSMKPATGGNGAVEPKSLSV